MGEGGYAWVNMCMNGGMLGNIIKSFECLLVRKALNKCIPFTIRLPQRLTLVHNQLQADSLIYLSVVHVCVQRRLYSVIHVCGYSQVGLFKHVQHVFGLGQTAKVYSPGG